MHLFDEEQYVLVEVAGTVVFLVGVLSLVGVEIPYLTAEFTPAYAVLVIAVGLVLMGYQKVARELVGILRRFRTPR